MNEDIMKLEVIKETAITLGIWDSPGTEDYRKIVKFSYKRNLLPWKLPTEKKVAYILIGLPGAGKNTWIEKNLSMVDNLANISRDDIRIELGYCKPDEKYLGTDEEEKNVTKVYDEKLEFALKHSKCIVLNNVHLKKKYRETAVIQLRSAGFEVVYVYIEAPTLEFNYKRRDGQIKEDRIKAMALSYEWPEPTEYDKLIIEKQSW
jgi:predicted kinase